MKTKSLSKLIKQAITQTNKQIQIKPEKDKSKTKTAIEQEKVVKIKCPDPECSVELKPEHLQCILPKKIIVDWESANCEASIALKEKFYCPYKNCSLLLVNDEAGRAITSCECPYCHRLFCAQCKVPWHGNMNCQEFEKSEIGQGLKQSDRKFLELAKREKWKRCPKCSMHVQRTTGCEHMRCRCGCHFCYMCGRDWNWYHTCNQNPRRNAPKVNAYTVHRKNQYKANLRNQINAKIELKPPTNQHKPKVAKTSPSNVNGHKNKIQIPIVRFSHQIRSKKTITPTETPKPLTTVLHILIATTEPNSSTHSDSIIQKT
ncbi:IBR domain protein [Medicago truncatula]|uniref:RBR-type E3 ubiquitin transferase n=1 Tax=Medicago truncatula TaxID=3880 RepID=A0A072UXJ4_MEDTR|nr:IBR domain protein [Medicago truncatula]